MRERDVTGLLGSVGKALAASADGGSAAATIESLPSREAVRAFLEAAELGIVEPARSEFIAAVTGDLWRDYQAGLAASVNQQYHELMAPGS